jgi:hypothetical protein
MGLGGGAGCLSGCAGHDLHSCQCRGDGHKTPVARPFGAVEPAPVASGVTGDGAAEPQPRNDRPRLWAHDPRLPKLAAASSGIVPLPDALTWTTISSPPYVRAAPLSLADAASQLGIRPVELAQAVREGKVATLRGRGGELLVARDEVERVRREGFWAQDEDGGVLLGELDAHGQK